MGTHTGKWDLTRPARSHLNFLTRFDSGFRDSGSSGQLEQEPHLEKAINAVRFVAQHVKNQDRYNKVQFPGLRSGNNACKTSIKIIRLTSYFNF